MRKLEKWEQKWERKHSPYLVIKELPPVNYLIQKSKYNIMTMSSGRICYHRLAPGQHYAKGLVQERI